jgi:hypothetical protein
MFPTAGPGHARDRISAESRIGEDASPGMLVARLLAGAPDASPRPLTLEEHELTTLVAFLCHSGAGALAWWRLRHHALAHSQAGQALRDMYLLHRIEAVAATRRLVDVLKRLKRAGVEPLLVKGWAIARHYPEPGLRPYSDLDLVIRPRDHGRARAALSTAPWSGVRIDLHAGPDHLLRGRALEDLMAHAEEVAIRDTFVRVPGAEDHLRILSLHALRHDVGRPIWLCDLAVALAARPRSFDWARCLGEDAREADWIACALGLAHRLVDAPVSDTPAAARSADLPAWLVRSVLRRWERSAAGNVSTRVPLARALPSLVRDPARLWEDLVLRWDRPIKYTLDLGRPFTSSPRWPIQIAGTALRARAVIATFFRGRLTRERLP